MERSFATCHELRSTVRKERMSAPLLANQVKDAQELNIALSNQNNLGLSLQVPLDIVDSEVRNESEVVVVDIILSMF